MAEAISAIKAGIIDVGIYCTQSLAIIDIGPVLTAANFSIVLCHRAV